MYRLPSKARAPAPRPAGTASASKAGPRTALRRMSFAEGAAALSPRSEAPGAPAPGAGPVPIPYPATAGAATGKGIEGPSSPVISVHGSEAGTTRDVASIVPSLGKKAVPLLKAKGRPRPQ